MDISSKLTIKLSVKDAEEMLAEAAVKMMKEQLGVIVAPSGIKITFNATTEYDQMDRGPGTPTFCGAVIEIIQPVKKGVPNDRYDPAAR